MKLIVWLGNPGKQYEKTRHNAGFMILDNFVERNKLGTFAYDNKYKGETFQATIDSEKVIFLKPQTFMNLSGESIWAIANFYKIAPADILIIHDEIDLPTGKIQLKLWWSSAGHNWLKSTIEKLWTLQSWSWSGKDFWRLRIGVDRPATKEQVVDYVLSTFKPEEKKLLVEQEANIEKLINEFLGK